jgi:hypothetical protein
MPHIYDDGHDQSDMLFLKFEANVGNLTLTMHKIEVGGYEFSCRCMYVLI